MSEEKPTIPVPEREAIKEWRRDLDAFGMSLLRHFIGWLGGLAISAISFFLALAKLDEAYWQLWIFAFAGFSYSCFQAWRDERKERAQAVESALWMEREKQAESEKAARDEEAARKRHFEGFIRALQDLAHEGEEWIRSIVNNGEDGKQMTPRTWDAQIRFILESVPMWAKEYEMLLDTTDVPAEMIEAAKANTNAYTPKENLRFLWARQQKLRRIIDQLITAYRP